MEGLIVERQLLSVITQPLCGLKLHNVNFIQLKTDTQAKRQHNRKYLKSNIQWRMVDEQYCVYVILSCGVYIGQFLISVNQIFFKKSFS